MAVSNPTLSFPKPRDILTKIIPIARTDSSTQKCVLPKGAVIANVRVLQTAAAVTGAGAVNVGWSGATTALLNAFSLPTASVGMALAGTAVGTQVVAATPLDSDKAVISTYTVGSSTAGGTGYVFIEYFMPGPGEGIDD